MIQLDVATRNAILNAMESSVGPAPTLRVRSGAMPASPAAARAGMVLATIVLPADWLLDASDGSKAQSGSWVDSSADASGVATYFDITDAAGVTRWQGDVGLAGSGAFMILTATSFTMGQAFSITSFVLTAPNG